MGSLAPARLLVAGLTLAALLLPGAAAVANVNVTAYGRVEMASDSASILAIVTRTAKLASQARESVALAVDQTVDALATGGGDVGITTDSLSVSPSTSYNSTTGVTKRLGYQVQQVLRVAIRNVTSQRLASVVDSIVRSSDVSINSITFGLQPATVKRMSVQARMRAAADAAGQARLYAQALGAELGPIISFQELSVSTQPASASGASDVLVDSEAARRAGIGQQAVQVSARAIYTLMPRPTGASALAAGG